MRLGVTVGRNGNDWAMIHGPEVPFDQQSRKFKEHRVSLFGMFEEIQLWSSSNGRVKRYKFKTTNAPAEEQDDAPEISETAPVSTPSTTPVAVPTPSAPEAADPFAGLKGIALTNAKRKAAKAQKDAAPAAKEAKPVSSPAPSKKPAKAAKSAAKAGK